jgi:hypothetical protein
MRRDGALSYRRKILSSLPTSDRASDINFAEKSLFERQQGAVNELSHLMQDCVDRLSLEILDIAKGHIEGRITSISNCFPGIRVAIPHRLGASSGANPPSQ